MQRGGASAAVEKIEQASSAMIFSGTARRTAWALILPRRRRKHQERSQTSMEKIDISSLPLPQLTEWVTGTLGEPKFRAGQIYRWIHQKRVGSFAEMTNLSTALRQKLEERAFLTVLTTRRRLESKLDETVKLLLELPDQNCVEAVLMRYEHGLSLCISTQVGCRMGCKFCASTLGGLVRSLTPAEMLGEVYEAERQAGEPISSLVLMGIGEPLDNYRNVLDFLTILSSPEGRNLSLRHVSLSTCGLCDRIDELAELGLGLTLSISLHAADDETRSGIMPVNKQYNIARLMQSCKNYFAKTGRRISYEYALIAGVNDSPAHAEALARLLGGQNCHVNLIPVNPVAERGTKRPDKGAVQRFAARLGALGLNATVRRELGSDIAAACGQLRRAEAGKAGDGTK
jgi:23S rRNA m2A2503 methyltransferase